MPDPMPAALPANPGVPAFDAREKARLFDAIAASGHAETALTQDGLQGFLVALAIGPEAPAGDDVVAAVLDTDDPGAIDTCIIDSIARWQQAIASDIVQCRLVIEPLTTRTGRLDYGGWARGFLEGAELVGMLDHGDPDEVDELLYPIHLLAGVIDDGERARIGPTRLREMVRECEQSLSGQVERIANYWTILLTPPETVRREGPKLGRNDPCHCGSGAKFKHCHGR